MYCSMQGNYQDMPLIIGQVKAFDMDTDTADSFSGHVLYSIVNSSGE